MRQLRTHDDAALLAGCNFIGEQMVDELERRELSLHCVPQMRRKILGGLIQTQLRQRLRHLLG